MNFLTTENVTINKEEANVPIFYISYRSGASRVCFDRDSIYIVTFTKNKSTKSILCNIDDPQNYKNFQEYFDIKYSTVQQIKEVKTKFKHFVYALYGL